MTYLFALASDSVPSDTSADVDSDILSAIDALTSLHTLVKSSLMVHESASDKHGAFLKVPTKNKGQEPILFGRIKSEPMTRESSEDDFKSL